MAENTNNIILEVKNLKKYFGGIKAVDGINLQVEEGNIVGLIGPNGAGKTTTFNCITGFLKRDSGEVYFKDKRIDGLPPHQIFNQGIARSFQITRPLEKMTVLENLLMAGRDVEGEKFLVSFFNTAKTAREEEQRVEKAMDVLDLIEIREKWDQITENLAGGEKRLLEFARATMSDPTMIMLDEPSSGLNQELKEKLREYIIEINRDNDQSFLVVGHDMNFIMKLCNPIYVMHQGKVLIKGTPDEIRSNDEVIDIYLGRT